MEKVIAALLRLSLSFWVGGAALFTIVLTPILFKTQPRDLAAQIVGVLFPAYFRWGLANGFLALVCLLLLRGRHFRLSLALLFLMLGLTACQAFVIEPRAAALKEEIGSFATTGRNDPRRREFSRLHGISMACNLGVLAGGVVLVILPAGCRRREQ